MSYIRASKTVASEAARSTVHGSSKVSNISQESSSLVSCFSTRLFTSEDIAFIQVKRKLKKLNEFKDLEGDKLLDKVNELIHVETILPKFSRLVKGVEGKFVAAMFKDVLEDENYPIHPDNVQEFCGAKEREESRHEQVAIIPLKISISDLDIPEPVMPLLCPIGNFLCTDYGTKHVGLTVGDVFLDWGYEDLVIPTIVEDGKADGEVLDMTKDCPHNIAADQKAPHNSLQLKTAAEEMDHLLPLILDKKTIFKKLAKVISRYNTKFHYHPISRNCQGFVRDALKALGIDNVSATPQPNPQPNPRLQELQSKKSKGIPSSFARHEDLDAYLMNQTLDWFEKLDAGSFEFLKFSYSYFHDGTACDRLACKAHILDDRVANKPPTPEPNPLL